MHIFALDLSIFRHRPSHLLPGFSSSDSLRINLIVPWASRGEVSPARPFGQSAARSIRRPDTPPLRQCAERPVRRTASPPNGQSAAQAMRRTARRPSELVCGRSLQNNSSGPPPATRLPHHTPRHWRPLSNCKSKHKKTPKKRTRSPEEHMPSEQGPSRSTCPKC